MNTEAILEFDKIKAQLEDYALSEGAKARLSALSPSLKEEVCRAQLEETTRARRTLDEYGTPPLTAMPEIDKILTLSVAGGMLTTSQLMAIAGFLTACQRMASYLKRAGSSDAVMRPVCKRPEVCKTRLLTLFTATRCRIRPRPGSMICAAILSAWKKRCSKSSPICCGPIAIFAATPIPCSVTATTRCPLNAS